MRPCSPGAEAPGRPRWSPSAGKVRLVRVRPALGGLRGDEAGDTHRVGVGRLPAALPRVHSESARSLCDCVHTCGGV